MLLDEDDSIECITVYDNKEVVNGEVEDEVQQLTLKVPRAHVAQPALAVSSGQVPSAMSLIKDQVLELAENYGVKIIVLQESKLNSDTHLKVKSYGSYGTNRQNKRGGGLIFFIRDIKYLGINVSSNIIGNSNLEIQGIRINWRSKYLNILNMYHPPDLNKLPIGLQNLFLPSTNCLGDLNAEHFMWGSSGINSRGVDMLIMADDKGFVFLKDGSPTHYSHSCNSKESLDVP
ncbi:hypothetical protein TNCV_4720651 [Trichonephila clavipes]|uniref:Endonuclease/exonuclease/phosphatase domain-containing protein n=1 Tax=Trichonephila clavipes TaxID=2585209 RepID=A0A8X7BFX9_TRICX|nr:hypothetical protein TNCV_4720651 [Trichonephila clavipes]